MILLEYFMKMQRRFVENAPRSIQSYFSSQNQTKALQPLFRLHLAVFLL